MAKNGSQLKDLISTYSCQEPDPFCYQGLPINHKFKIILKELDYFSKAY